MRRPTTSSFSRNPRMALADPPVYTRPDAAYGDGLGRCFELHNAPALSVQLHGHSTFAVTRLNCDGERAGLMREIPPQDAYLAFLHLRAVRHHETWMAGRPVLARGYDAGTLQIVDLQDEVAAYLVGPWDALGFLLPRSLVRGIGTAAGGIGAPRIDALACEPGTVDPVLAHLGAAALLLMARRQAPGAALQRRLALATSAHLVHTYGMRRREGYRLEAARTCSARHRH